MSNSSPTVPPFAAILRHQVADWSAWKSAFDAHQEARKASGMLGHHINRGLDNPNDITLFLAISDVEKALAFSQSDDLAQAMKGAGVLAPPTVQWVTPVSQNIEWEQSLPAMIVTHAVSDFDRWHEGYIAADAIRLNGGIIGDAVNRGLDQPNLVIVYHQAKSFDTLKAFAASPELQSAMQRLGVTSAPQIDFVTGGWPGRY